MQQKFVSLFNSLVFAGRFGHEQGSLLEYKENSDYSQYFEQHLSIITVRDLDMLIASSGFYEYFERLIWGQSNSIEKLIVYLMWSSPKFTKDEVIDQFIQRELAIEGIENSLKTLETYTILSRKNNSYFFTYQEFAKFIEARNDINVLVETYQKEIKNL